MANPKWAVSCWGTGRDHRTILCVHKSYEKHLRYCPPPPAAPVTSRVSVLGGTLLPPRAGRFPLSQVRVDGGRHPRRPQVAGTGAPVLRGTSWPAKHTALLVETPRGLSLGPGSLPNLSSDRNLERRGETCTLSAVDPGLLVMRPPAWHGRHPVVGTSCGFHAMLTRHMTQKTSSVVQPTLNSDAVLNSNSLS